MKLKIEKMILAKIYYNIFTFKIHIKFSVKYNMSKKSISINPNFFKIGKAGKTPKEKKPKKKRPINSLKPNNVKKKLIEKIKAHHQREKEKEILSQEQEEKEFQDTFKETLNYLQDLDLKSKKKKKKKKRDKTMKKVTYLFILHLFKTLLIFHMHQLRLMVV